MPLKDGSRGNSVGNSINGRVRKDERRYAAFAREAANANLSPIQKLKALDKFNPNGGHRQRARLIEQCKLIEQVKAKGNVSAEKAKERKQEKKNARAGDLNV